MKTYSGLSRRLAFDKNSIRGLYSIELQDSIQSSIWVSLQSMSEVEIK